MRIRNLAAAMLLGVATIGVSACATNLPTQVSRFQAMPAPAGQTFHVVPGEGARGGLEFSHYASLVARQLEAQGYRAASNPQAADMVVRLSYAVDEGRVERSIDPFAHSRYADPFYRGYFDPWGRFYGRPYWSRFGYYGGVSRSPFYYGWDDPFWYRSPYAGYGRGFRDPVREYTVYHANLNMDIVRRVDNQPLFEGQAQARSQTDELGVLVPNLIEAMFTGFPGRSGETVRITVPARKRS
ncbi:MAG TPA: DUF4136 domain-containing protein [Sphingomicrobium sp.]|jgi:hypothetical protein|nr:DUF4136 domain-containing protein [Sphingomicrobium sp.]